MQHSQDDLSTRSLNQLKQSTSISKLAPLTRKLLNQEIKAIIQAATDSKRQHLQEYIQEIQDMLVYEEKQSVGIQLQLNIPAPTPSPICSVTVGYDYTSSKIFKCFDCIQADNAIQCIQCFSAADHKGHNFIQTVTGQGCCDCGNEQMLNPKGFCPAHSKKIGKVDVPFAIKQNFLADGTFYFYVMFWLINRTEKFCFSGLFVKRQSNILFQELHRLSRKDYDYKVVIVQLLRLKLGEIYPNLPKIQQEQLSIIQMIFRCQQSGFMEHFCRIAYQIFPVEDCRADIIKEYFWKTSKDPDFDFHHPLRLLNFQFMTCIKQINSMIKQKQLKPLRLPQLQAIKSSKQKNHLFLKWVDDMQYPSQMKGSRQYHCYLIEHYNIAETLFTYRQLPDDDVFKQALDDYYIKTMKYVLQNIRKQKHLLEKVIKEIWVFICRVQKASSSLIHQRIFAFTVSIYLQGQLSRLSETKNLSNLQMIIGLDMDNEKQILSRLVSYHLKNSIQCFLLQSQNIPRDYVKEYFKFHNHQFKLDFKLDCLYQKILLLMSQHLAIYPSAVLSILKQLSKSSRSIIQFQFISYLNSIVAVDADQIQIETQIELHNKERLYRFYDRFINSFKDIKARQMKDRTLLVISHKASLQAYIKQRCIIEKEILRPNDSKQTLEFLQYNFYLERLSIDIQKQPQKQLCFNVLPYLKKPVLWDDNIIHHLIQLTNSVCETHKEPIETYNQHRFLPSLLGFELLKIYLTTNQHAIKTYLKESLFQKMVALHCQKLTSALRQTFAIDQQSPSRDFPVIEGQRLKKKKELLAAKHRSVQKIYQNVDIDVEKSSQGVECITCKQHTQEPLMLISAVSIQNFFNKSFLKSDSFRLCFRTCNHIIHKSCFYKGQNLVEKNCFLCRRPANLLIPILSDELSQPPKNFLAALLPILLETQLDYEHQQQIIKKLEQTVCEQKLSRGIINSIITEVLLFETSQDNFAKLYIAPIIKTLLQYLKLLPKQLLHQAFEIDKSYLPANTEKTHLYVLARQILQQYCQGKPVQSPKETSHSDEVQIIRAVMNFFDSGKEKQMKCSEQLPLVKLWKELFDIPVSLTDLHKHMGKCPSCLTFTQNICLCLVCGYKACAKEKSKLVEHFQFHLGGTVLIKCDNGMPLYMTNGDYLFLRPSIYLNYLGQPFDNKNTVVPKKPSEYNLDKLSYSRIEQTLVRNEMKAHLYKQTS